jgi:hypothetical protein
MLYFYCNENTWHLAQPLAMFTMDLLSAMLYTNVYGVLRKLSGG